MTDIDVALLPITCGECKHDIGMLISDKDKGKKMRDFLSENQIYPLCQSCYKAVVKLE